MAGRQQDGTLAEALEALTELVRLARLYRDAAEVEGRPGSAQTWAQLAGHLDAVRTTALQEGAGYLPVAWAFVDSGRLTIGRALARDSRRPGRRPAADTPAPTIPGERPAQ